CDRRRYEYARTCARVARRPDQPSSHGSDQQRLGDPREPQRAAPATAFLMTIADIGLELAPSHRKALARAHAQLESRSLALRIAEAAGQPVDRLVGMMPKVATNALNFAVEAAILNCLKLAIRSIEPDARRAPANSLASLLAGLSGGVSGFFGFAALPFGLPVATTLMLRTISATAGHNSEDLREHQARLARLRGVSLGGGETP